MRASRTVILLSSAVVLVLAAGGGAYALRAGRGPTPTPASAPRVLASRPSTAPAGPTATPIAVATAGTLSRTGAPKPPVELPVPFVGGTWPVGVFVLDRRVGPSKQAGLKTVTVELGILNEASQPLLVAVAGQYKEAVSLYSEGRWKGLFFVGFRTAAGQALTPTGGAGAAELPPGVWGQTEVELDTAEVDSVSQLELGLRKDAMQAHQIAAITLAPSGQPWASAGAAPTPVAISATPAPARSG